MLCVLTRGLNLVDCDGSLSQQAGVHFDELIHLCPGRRGILARYQTWYDWIGYRIRFVITVDK
jgi:hypothetical protein